MHVVHGQQKGGFKHCECTEIERLRFSANVKALSNRWRIFFRRFLLQQFSAIAPWDGKIAGDCLVHSVSVLICPSSPLILGRKKGVHTTTVAPLLSRSVARPRGHRAKKAMVYTIPLGKQGKRVYTMGSERRVYTMEATDPKKKKGGFPQWWCTLFRSVFLFTHG